MIFKGALLSAAGLLLTCPAVLAAETCGTAGQGLRLPGSDTCVRLSGFARAEAAAASGSASRLVTGGVSSAGVRTSRLRAQGQVDFDARTETAGGPVRTFLSVRTR